MLVIAGLKRGALNNVVGERKLAGKRTKSDVPPGRIAVDHLAACKAAESGVRLTGLNVVGTGVWNCA